jgi:hypothetical protein
LSKASGFDARPDRRARLAAFAEGYGTSAAGILDRAVAVREAELQRIERLAAADLDLWATFVQRGLNTGLAQELVWFRDFVPKFSAV